MFILSSVLASGKVRGSDWQMNARQFGARDSQMMPGLCCQLVLMNWWCWRSVVWMVNCSYTGHMVTWEKMLQYPPELQSFDSPEGSGWKTSSGYGGTGPCNLLFFCHEEETAWGSPSRVSTLSNLWICLVWGCSGVGSWRRCLKRSV